MQNDADLIIDLWGRLKHSIPKKDRLGAADTIVATFDEYGLSEGLEEETGLDKELDAAVKSHFGIGQNEEEEYDWD